MINQLLSSKAFMSSVFFGMLFVIFLPTIGGTYVVFAQGADNSTAEGTVPSGSLELTNLDIPSLDITLPDGSSTSADFRSIYFDSGSQKIYAYYNDYGIPEMKPQLNVGDTFTVDAYLTHTGTPSPSNIAISISKITSGEESGNFTQMQLDNPVTVTSSGNTYTVPETSPGSYILDVFVNYPFGGIVAVYTMEVQVASPAA